MYYLQYDVDNNILSTIYFISHPEVDINPDVPVPQWPLSEKGRSRMQEMLHKNWIQEISAIYCSTEQKAIDGAEILSSHLDLTYVAVEELGENDRSSTGFLEPIEFEATADCFFNAPESSILGWETAIKAQSRIVNAVVNIAQENTTDGSIAIVSHGAVGTLLFCHLTKKRIDRRWDQPGSGGGNYMRITLGAKPSCTWWEAID